jgi:hypothetical protein
MDAESDPSYDRTARFRRAQRDVRATPRFADARYCAAFQPVGAKWASSRRIRMPNVPPPGRRPARPPDGPGRGVRTGGRVTKA